MTDKFRNRESSLESTARRAEAVTPNDAADLPNFSRALYVGGGGDVRVTTVGGDTVTLTAASGLYIGHRYRGALVMLGFGLGVWPNGTLQAGGPNAPPPPPSQEATPGLAWNVGQLSPVSPNRPYLNLAKQSGGWLADNGAAFTKNADGYPTAMENGATKYVSSVNIGTEETSFRSRWRLTWDGDGTMAAGQSTTNVATVGPNEIEFMPAAIINNLKIFWEITGFGATGVSNVAVVRIDRKDLYDAGE